MPADAKRFLSSLCSSLSISDRPWSKKRGKKKTFSRTQMSYFLPRLKAKITAVEYFKRADNTAHPYPQHHRHNICSVSRKRHLPLLSSSFANLPFLKCPLCFSIVNCPEHSTHASTPTRTTAYSGIGANVWEAGYEPKPNVKEISDIRLTLLHTALGDTRFVAWTTRCFLPIDVTYFDSLVRQTLHSDPPPPQPPPHHHTTTNTHTV